MNSLFYPFIDPVTGLPIIDPGIMSQLDPNSQDKKKNIENELHNYEMFQKQIFEFTKQGGKNFLKSLQIYCMYCL